MRQFGQCQLILFLILYERRNDRGTIRSSVTPPAVGRLHWVLIPGRDPCRPILARPGISKTVMTSPRKRLVLLVKGDTENLLQRVMALAKILVLVESPAEGCAITNTKNYERKKFNKQQAATNCRATKLYID